MKTSTEKWLNAAALTLSLSTSPLTAPGSNTHQTSPPSLTESLARKSPLCQKSYHTVPSFISEGGWDRWLLYPLPLSDSEVKGGLGPNTSEEMLCRGPGMPGSGLGESPGWWDMISEKRCTSLEGWCPGRGWSILPRGVPVGPEEGTKGRSTGVWACEDGGPWGKKS